MICHIESIYKFFVHPVQDVTAEYDALESELMKWREECKAVSERRFSVDDFSVGEFWITEDPLCRVKIVSVDKEASSAVVFQVDWGSTLTVELSSLLPFPEHHLIRTLPGLAVECYLTFDNHHPEGGFAEELECLLVDNEIYTAAVAEEDEGRFGIIVFLLDKDDTILNLNQLLAHQTVLDTNDDEEMKVSDDPEWDPMLEDYLDEANNYNTNDDDLEQATDGYKSKTRVCQFFQNTGKCYKGDYCEVIMFVNQFLLYFLSLLSPGPALQPEERSSDCG